MNNAIAGAPSKAIGFAAMTILFWSTSATAFKLSLAHLNFLLLVFYAALASMLVLGFLCVVLGKIKQLRSWKRLDYSRSLLLGALNPGLYYIVLFKAFDLLPAQEAEVLNFTWPIVLTLLGAVFLRQQLSFTDMLAICVSFVGVAIVASHGDLVNFQFSNAMGVVLALGSTLVWAVYWLVNQTETKDSLLRLFTNFTAGVIWLAVLISLTDSWALPSVKGLAGAIYIGLFEMSLAFFCWFQALKLARNVSLLNNMIYLTPFASLGVIWWVLDEPIFPSTWLGLGLISGSILFQGWMQNRSFDSG